MNIMTLAIDELFQALTIDTIKEVDTKDLIAFWNAHHIDAIIKKFADRKTAERRVLALVEELHTASANEQPTLPIDAPTHKTRASRKVEESTEDQKSEEEISEEEALAEIRKMREGKKEEKAAGRSLSDAIAASWADEKVAEARMTRHAVKVTVGQKSAEFKSTRAAFNALSLPDSKHIRFRMALKKAGKMVFEHDGRKYLFEIVEATE